MSSTDKNAPPPEQAAQGAGKDRPDSGTKGAAPGHAAQEAGQNSPHLEEAEQQQAADSAALGPLVIHEIVRAEGEDELKRGFSGLAWSGLAAGLSIGFSFLVQAHLRAGLPDAPWRTLITSFGYSLGFLIAILGRQQLFTETTLTALIPFLTRRDLSTFRATMRVWLIVLVANLAGTVVFGFILTTPGLYEPSVTQAMIALAEHTMAESFWLTVLRAGSAGWLIGLMVWLLPSAGPARPLIVILLTYVVALFQLPHIVAGSVEAVYAVLSGHASIGDYFMRFLAPTLLGNVLGGTILAALLNHAPVAGEIRSRSAE